MKVDGATLGTGALAHNLLGRMEWLQMQSLKQKEPWVGGICIAF